MDCCTVAVSSDRLLPRSEMRTRWLLWRSVIPYPIKHLVVLVLESRSFDRFPTQKSASLA